MQQELFVWKSWCVVEHELSLLQSCGRSVHRVGVDLSLWCVRAYYCAVTACRHTQFEDLHPAGSLHSLTRRARGSRAESEVTSATFRENCTFPSAGVFARRVSLEIVTMNTQPSCHWLLPSPPPPPPIPHVATQVIRVQDPRVCRCQCRVNLLQCLSGALHASVRPSIHRNSFGGYFRRHAAADLASLLLREQSLIAAAVTALTEGISLAKPTGRCLGAA